jgi:hypothetical protein
MPSPPRQQMPGVFVALRLGSDPANETSAHDNGGRVGDSLQVAQAGGAREERILRALLIIVGSPGIGVSQLAKLMFIQQPTASQLIRELAARRWIGAARDPCDRRARRIHATFEGQAIIRGNPMN